MSEYPSDWRVLPLGEVAEVVGGGTPSRDVPAFWGNDHHWITPSEVVAKDGQTADRSKEQISDLGLQSSGAKLHPPGTILMTSRASIGFAAIAKEEICTNQGFQSLRCRSKLDNWFALHQIRHRRAELQQLAAGSTFLEVSGSNVRSFPFIVPPLPEQKKIAEMLSGIDNLIASTKQQEAKHRELALGIAENILDSNCEYTRLGDVTTLITKGTTPTSLGMSFSEQGINFIKVESIISDGVIDPGKFSFIGSDVHDALKRSQIKSKDILFTIAGATVGKLALAEEHLLPANTNQALAIIRVKSETLRPQFAYHWLKGGAVKTIVDQLQTVGAQPNVSLSQIGNFPMPIMPLDSQDNICNKLDSIDRVINSIRKKIFMMQNLRQSLASDLLSGRKRVSV